MPNSFPAGFNRADFEQLPDAEELLGRVADLQSKAGEILDRFPKTVDTLEFTRQRAKGGTDPIEGEGRAALDHLQLMHDAVSTTLRRLAGLGAPAGDNERNASLRKQYMSDLTLLEDEFPIALADAKRKLNLA